MTIANHLHYNDCDIYTQLMSSQEIHQSLTDFGYKLTSPRKKVAAWINNHKGIFSVSEILADLSELDTVSVYRTLKLFCSLDIIHKIISLHGKQHYELHAKQKHHHHVVCTKCEKSSCLPCNNPKKKIPSFKNIHHSVIFTGLCEPCAT